jgi:hypothetical protein
LKRKFVLFRKDINFQLVMQKEKAMVGQGIPCPGKKAFPAFRGTKKGGGSSFLNAGFRRFSPGDPFATASLCGNEGEATEKVSPGPFWLRRLLSCPGNKETGLNDPLNWR